MLGILLFIIIIAAIVLSWESIEKNVKNETILDIGAGVIVFVVPVILLALLFIHFFWPLIVAGLGVTLVANSWRTL